MAPVVGFGTGQKCGYVFQNDVAMSVGHSMACILDHLMYDLMVPRSKLPHRTGWYDIIICTPKCKYGHLTTP